MSISLTYILSILSILSVIPITSASISLYEKMYGITKKKVKKGKSINIKGISYSFMPIGDFVIDVKYGSEAKVDVLEKAYHLTSEIMNFEYSFRSQKYVVTSEIKGERVIVTVKRL